MPNWLRWPVVRLRAFYRGLSPSQAVVVGYASYTVIVFLLLSLPGMVRSGSDVSLLDRAFTAVSAVTTTGLTVASTAEDFSFAAQVVILVALQVGGLGYMTFGSFVIMASGGRISSTRMHIGRSILAMPDHFDAVAFLRHGLYFTVFVQTAGALALWSAFARAGVESPLWAGIFHSISAFCTAGFSVFPNSMESFANRGDIQFIIAVLSLLGAIGFIVVTDLYMRAKGRSQRVTFTTRIIIASTAGGLVLGTALLSIDPNLGHLSVGERIWSGFFQTMAAQTTVGFNTVSISQYSAASVVVFLVLMILGASPSGTGGGLKSTTWSAALGTCWSAIRGRKEASLLGCTIPPYRTQAAFGAITLYMIVYVVGCFVLTSVDRHKFEDLIFEAASALSTAGLSRGITSELTDAGKLTIMALMFIGRAGVLSLGLAALAKPDADDIPPAPVEDIVVG